MSSLPARPPLLWALAVAALAGGFHAAVFPPWGLDNFAWVALLPIFALLRVETSALRATLLAWVFALATGIGMVWWVFDALTDVYGLRRLVAGPAAAGWIGVYTLAWALVGPLAVRLRRGWLPPFCAAPIAWISAEWVRSSAFGGMPWMLLGHSQYQSPAVLQLAELGGVAGISLVLVAVNALLVEAALSMRGNGRPAPWLLGALGLFVAVAGGGSLRLRAVEAWKPASTPVTVGLVHAATPQEERWNPSFRRATLDRQLELTRRAARAGATLIVWSETALDFSPAEEATLSGEIAAALGGEGRWLLAGAPLPVAGRAGTFTNSAALFDSEGAITAHYAKERLVPVAEYEPAWLAQIPALQEPLEPVLRGFPYEAGRSHAPLSVAGLELGVLICFEAIFPELTRAAVDSGADVLVTISNDSFFPPRAGAEQHFAMAVFRAVETRRPLIRVANRGVSAVVQPSGRIEQRVETNEPVMRLAPISPRRSRTPYLLGGWALPWIVAGLACTCLVPRRTTQARDSAMRG